MSIFEKQKLSTKTKVKIGIISAIILLILAYVIWDVVSTGPITSLFNDRDRLIKAVNDFGAFGPLLYILLQIAQTVLAPIPGNVVGGLGGFLFGWWGVLWTTIGATAGAFGVFLISRKLGRSLVEKFVKKEALDKFDFVFGKHSKIILFLIYLIPGLPDDVVCYIAGLTDVPIVTLLILFSLGRLPAVIVNNYVGMGLSEGNLTLVSILVVAGVLLLGIIYWQQDNIMKLLGAKKGSAASDPSETQHSDDAQ